jgi:hypothetical protein
VFWQVALLRGAQLVVLSCASEPAVIEQFEKLLLLPFICLLSTGGAVAWCAAGGAGLCE